VLLLAYYYLSQHTVSHGMPVRRFSEEARDLLLVYPWPGNVRELKNATERAVLMTEGDLVRPEDLTIDRRSRRKAVPPAGGVRTDVQGEVSVAFPPEGVSLEKVERELIKAALAHTGGNVTQAAALLHLSRDTLRYRMAKHEEGASREPGEN
jgi:DNA-binding NtrC family response regulator